MAHAQAIPRQGSITIYGFAGGINQSMKDVNQILEDQEQALREDHLLPNYKLYDLTWSLGGGLGYQLMERVNLGVEYSYQDQQLQNDVFVGPVNATSGILNFTWGQCQNLTLNLTWYTPLDEGLFVGAGAGYAWSGMEEKISIRAAGQADLDSDLSGDWTANGLAAQGFLGYNFNFVAGSTVQVRAGYRYLKMSGLEGTSTSTTTDPVSGAPITEPTATLPMGEVDWDFGGFNAVLVLGFPFFGHHD
jgi:opacity protein-like surface antigen